MKPKIVPTVGRMVHCHGVSNHGPIPGVIIHAWGNTPDSCVNVLAFGDGSNEPLMQPMMSVRVYDPDEPRNAEEDCCTWMPYQMGQAAKTEAAEAALKNAENTTPV